MKSMKRSMFVTTILMVVLLVVALSTATFAWYTANTQVGVTSTTVNSAQSTASSLAIDYLSTNTTSSNSSVELTLTNNSVFPMIPTIQPVTTGEGTALSAFTFTGAPINNVNVFTANGSALNPASISAVKVGESNHSQTSFFVINTNESNAADHVYAKVTIDTTNAYRLTKTEPANWDGHETDYFTRSGDTFTSVTGTPAWAADTYYELYTGIASDMRIALFARTVTAPAGTFKYVGTWASTAAATYYGTITQGNGKTESPLATYTATASGTQIDLGSIAALGSKEVCLVAWFDGPSLEVNEAQSAASFTINFSTNQE